MRERMQALAARLDNAQSRFATQRKHRIEALRHRLLSRHPAQTLDLLSARTRALQERLHFYSQNTLNRQQAQLQQFGARLHVLSPLATLGRGYSILLDEPVVDLDDLLRQQLYLSLPVKNLCAEECRGLCPGCGANLNQADCTCGAGEDRSPFAVLRQLQALVHSTAA